MIFCIFLIIVAVIIGVIFSSGGSQHFHHFSPNIKRDYYGGEIPTPYEDDSGDLNIADETAREAYLLAMEGDIDASDVDDFDDGDDARYWDAEDEENW